MDIFEQIGIFLDWIYTGIYDFVVDTAAYLIALSVKATLYSTLALIDFSWDIAQQLLSDLGISQFLNSMYSQFNFQIMEILLYFRIPEFINTILGAHMTKFVFNFLGGKGLL